MDQIAILITLVAGITATVFTIVIHSLALTAAFGFAVSEELAARASRS